jgi:murein DD-endopeptidase MepM/ murein hydrolase activator NlpD
MTRTGVFHRWGGRLLLAFLLLTGTAACSRNLAASATALADTPTGISPTGAKCTSPQDARYVLPFPAGKTYECMQTFDGPFSHQGVFKYSVDFSMPIGTTVTAARAGQVTRIQESFPDDDSTPGDENYVIVQHDDGTYARYVHLTREGALVETGQIVAPGDVIGLSGSSGTPIPHLHFDVTAGCPQPECQTIPFCFSNTDWSPDGLQAGMDYTAEPYPTAAP